MRTSSRTSRRLRGGGRPPGGPLELPARGGSGQSGEERGASRRRRLEAVQPSHHINRLEGSVEVGDQVALAAPADPFESALECCRHQGHGYDAELEIAGILGLLSQGGGAIDAGRQRLERRQPESVVIGDVGEAETDSQPLRSSEAGSVQATSAHSSIEPPSGIFSSSGSRSPASRQSGARTRIPPALMSSTLWKRDWLGGR